MRQSYPRKRIHAYADNWIDRWEAMTGIRPEAIIRHPDKGPGQTLFRRDGQYRTMLAWWRQSAKMPSMQRGAQRG